MLSSNIKTRCAERDSAYSLSINKTFSSCCADGIPKSVVSGNYSRVSCFQIRHSISLSAGSYFIPASFHRFIYVKWF